MTTYDNPLLGHITEEQMKQLGEAANKAGVSIQEAINAFAEKIPAIVSAFVDMLPTLVDITANAAQTIIETALKDGTLTLTLAAGDGVLIKLPEGDFIKTTAKTEQNLALRAPVTGTSSVGMEDHYLYNLTDGIVNSANAARVTAKDGTVTRDSVIKETVYIDEDGYTLLAFKQ